MLYVPNIQNVSTHRTCTPLYEKYEATPLATFLDPNQATGAIYSGMVMYRTGGDTVALLDGASTFNSGLSRPLGLSALDSNSNIDDYTNTLNNSWAVWTGGNNAIFQIEAPAFDTTATYTVPTNGSHQFLYPLDSSTITNTAVQFVGQLTSASQTASTAGVVPVAYLIDVLGPTTLVVGLVPFAVATTV